MCQNSMNHPGENLSLPLLTADPHVDRNTYDELQHLAQNLTQKQIQPVHKVVKRMWEETLGEGMKEALPECIPVEYWNETCYPVMRKLFTCKAVRNDVHVDLSSNMKWKRRKIVIMNSLERTSTSEALTSQQCWRRQSAATNIRYQGILIVGDPEQVRHVHTSKSPVRKGLMSALPIQSAVLNIMCADATGPVTMTMWNSPVSGVVEGYKEACRRDHDGADNGTHV